MSVHNTNRYDELLQNEEYQTILIELDGCNGPDDQLVKGIAHYKLNQADKANEIFETLHTQHPSNEIHGLFYHHKTEVERRYVSVKVIQRPLFQRKQSNSS